MVLDTIWRYEFDMLWIWGYDFDMGFVTILILIWYGFDMVPVSWLQTNRNSPGTGFWSSFQVFLWFRYDFDMVLIRFWYDFVTILIRFWYDFDTVLMWFQWVGFKKRNRKSRGTGFWSIFRRFLCFDLILIRFWYGFDTILNIFWIWFQWVGFKSQVWPLTETISKS